MDIISVQRYTKKVKIAKNAIALLAAILLLYMFSLLFVQPNSDRIKIVYAQAITEKDKLRIINPILYALSKKNEIFKITASSGVQSSDADEMVFNDISGKISMNRDASTIFVASGKGVVYPKLGHIDLLGNVTMKSSENYDAKTEVAIISLDNYDVWGESTIFMSGKYGSVKANKFHFFNNQQVMVFEGEIVTIIK